MLKTLRFIVDHPLNRQGRVRALGRFLRWQLVSILSPGRVEVPFVGGARFFMRRGMTGATGNYYCGLHESDEMGFVLHFLRPDDLFCDVGANVGSYTILAAGGVGARVLSIEPIPATFHALEDNVRLNRLESLVECHRIGVAAHSGVLRFTSGDDTMNRIVEEEGEDVISVNVETIDGVLGGRCPALMKIDVEGHEYGALTGADSTLRDGRLAAIIMETNGLSDRQGHTAEDLIKLVSGFGFTLCRYDAIRRELVPGGHGNNSIFVRDLNAARLRCRNAPRFKLANGSI